MPNVHPQNWQALSAPPEADAPRVAIVDTGVLGEHPLLKLRLATEDQRDFTDTGGAITNGHGTQVAIGHLLVAPNSRLLSAKVLADNAASADLQARRIGEGIRWATERAARITIVCVGFRKRCGPKHEPVCAAVRHALDEGGLVFVAGGARCPALCDGRVEVVGELEPDGTADSSAPPDYVYPTPGNVQMVPWDHWLRGNLKEEESP